MRCAAAWVFHAVRTEPREWAAVSAALVRRAPVGLEPSGGVLFGIWRSQIGRPRDELTVMTAWPDPAAARAAGERLLDGVAGVREARHEPLSPTLRPSVVEPPRRQGNFAFRWFDTPLEHWEEFLDLCAGAWPGFEAAYDSQVLGLWRCAEPTAGRGEAGGVRSLLLTRRPSLAMWERSKKPEGPAEVEVRRKLSRRYDLCDATEVYTTTLLTAADRSDDVRWA